MKSCKWCKGETDGTSPNFCCKLHRKYYENFRAGFYSEIADIKLKPKVSDTKEYKKSGVI